MKIKFILMSFLVVFVSLFNEGIFAYAFKCDEVAMYCNYEGIQKKISEADEEFNMLLEPEWHSNFKDMFTVLFYIVGCSEENKACMEALKDPNCKISAYIKKLVNFYEANVVKIKDKEVIKLFKALQKGEGKIFFSKERPFE